MAKLNNFISKRCDKVIKSKKSTYYKFGNVILRVSNHIGQQSSGSFSIIVDKRDNYMIHAHGSGAITSVTYDQVKTFVKGIKIHEDLALNPAQQVCNWAIKEQEQLALKDENKTLRDEITTLQKENGRLGNIIGGYRMNAKKAIDKAVAKELERRSEPIKKIVLK